MDYTCVVGITLLNVFGLEIQNTVLGYHFIDHSHELLVLVGIRAMAFISRVHQHLRVVIALFFIFLLVIIHIVVLQSNDRL